MIALGRRAIVPALLVLGTAAINLAWLGDAPAYFNKDELVYALNAQALADSGQDLNGRDLPMYPAYPAHLGRPTFLQPMLIYLIALSLKVLPLSEVVARLPMALAGIVNVLLVYCIARRLFSRELIAVWAAVMLAISPAHIYYSRLAVDFLASVPFFLGWVLCLVIYFRHEHPRLLFLAGLLLGVGMYGYVGSYLLAPIYVVLTFAVLYQRREPLARYGWLMAGVTLPTLIVLPWMFSQPVPILEIVGHYSETRSMGASADLVAMAPVLYRGFLGLRFLFVDGSYRLAQPMALFLLPVAGLLVVGGIRAVTRRDPIDLLLLGAFLATPLPASFVGEDLTMWRVLPLLPFGLLLAASGLQRLTEPESPIARRMAFVIVFGVPIALAWWYSSHLPQATPILRASAVPVALLVLTILLKRFSIDRLKLRQVAVVAASVIVTYQVAVRLNLTTVFLVAQWGLCLAAIVRGVPLDRWWGGPMAGVALLAYASVDLVNLHVDYTAWRPARIPAGVVVLVTHGLLAAVVFLLTLGLARLLRSMSRSRVVRPARSAVPGLVVVAVGLSVLIQVTYFHLSAFSQGTRFFVIAALFLAAIAFPLRYGRGLFGRRGLVLVAAVAVFTIGATQLVYFAVDYQTRYRLYRSGQAEGNVRSAWEPLVEWARTRPVPAIYLAEPLPPFSLDEAYLRFYLIKHNRRDLLARVTVGERGREFDPERIRQLPPNSVVITAPPGVGEAGVEPMVTSGELKPIELARAADGTPLLWILERK